MIAVNPTEQTVITTIAVPSLAKVKNGTIAVYHEGRVRKLSRGGISDSFGPYAVHIYVAPPSSFYAATPVSRGMISRP